jgi:Protein of unknown function (DUF2911)
VRPHIRRCLRRFKYLQLISLELTVFELELTSEPRNQHAGEWGIPYKYESAELVRLPMSVRKATSPIENFAIDFDHAGASSTMRIRWEDAAAAVELTEKNTDIPLTQ